MDTRADFLPQQQIVALLPPRTCTLRMLLEVCANAERPAFSGEYHHTYVPIVLGSSERVERLAKELLDHGVEAMRSVETNFCQSGSRRRVGDALVFCHGSGSHW